MDFSDEFFDNFYYTHKNDIQRRYKKLFEKFSDFMELLEKDKQWVKREWSSPDGSVHGCEWTKHYCTDTQIPASKDLNIEFKIDRLENELQQAVNSEDYQLAITIRDQISNLKEKKTEIQKLEKKIAKSIEDRKYEDTIKFKKQIDELMHIDSLQKKQLKSSKNEDKPDSTIEE